MLAIAQVDHLQLCKQYENENVRCTEYKKEFREHRRLLMSLNHEGSKFNHENIDYNEIINILNIRSLAIRKFIEKMKQVDKENRLYNNTEDILGSLLHLHLNRLLGIDRKRETKVMTYVRHTLYNLRYLKEGIK